MTDWGFYCDVESGRLLDNPYIFPIYKKEETNTIQIIYIIILIPFIAFIYKCIN